MLVRDNVPPGVFFNWYFFGGELNALSVHLNVFSHSLIML